MIGNIKNFRFWCQKVIPLVYDNSLSYYEVLCKVVHYLNHVIDDINEIPEYIDEKIKESFDEEHIKELIMEVFQTLEDAISNNNEGQNTNFSKDYPNLGTLLWHDNKLYETIRVIDEGDAILEGVNIQLVNFGDMFDDFIDEVKENFTEYDDGKRETASIDRPIHQLVWLDDVLYEVIKPIAEGNAYIYSGDNKNVEPITMNYIYQYILGLIANEAQTRASEDARIELELGNLITSRVNAEAETRAEEDARIEVELGELITSRVNAEAEARTEEDTRIEMELTELITSKVGIEANLRASEDTRIYSELNELIPSIYDISKHGAVADGVTDNTAIIQAGIDSGLAVYIPSGEWATHNLICKYSTRIFGDTDGYGNSGTGGSVLKALDTSGAVITIPRLMHKVILSNFAIYGGANDSNSVNGIDIEHTASDYLLENLYIHFCNNGINAGSTGWATINRCFIENCYGDAFHFENGNIASERPLQVNVINCLAENCNGTGFKYINNTSGTAPAGTLLNCATFANHGNGVSYAGTNGYGFSAIRIDNCFFGNDDGAELRLLNTMENYTATISNSQFELCGIGTNGVRNSLTGSQNAFGVIMGSNTDAAFSNCLFASNSNAAIYLSSCKVNLSNCRTRANSVYAGDAEITSVSASKAQIFGCRFYASNTKSGLKFYNANDWLTAIGNTFENNTDANAIVTLPANTLIHTYMNVQSDGTLI